MVFYLFKCWQYRSLQITDITDIFLYVAILHFLKCNVCSDSVVLMVWLGLGIKTRKYHVLVQNNRFGCYQHV